MYEILIAKLKQLENKNCYIRLIAGVIIIQSPHKLILSFHPSNQ